MSATEKLSITLPEEMVQAIKARVSAGASASEVIREAVRAWQHQEEGRAARIASIRARIHRSLAGPRRDLDGDAVTARLDALHGPRCTRLRFAIVPRRLPIWRTSTVLC